VQIAARSDGAGREAFAAATEVSAKFIDYRAGGVALLSIQALASLAGIMLLGSRCFGIGLGSLSCCLHNGSSCRGGGVMASIRSLFALIAALVVATTAQAAVTLSGTIRDFCAPDIAGTCTRLTDFEGAVPGVVTGMVAPTLTGGLPTPGPNIVTGASSAANFGKWYVDSPGFNLSTPFSLTLTEGPPGTFTYSNPAFFPIDGLLYGDQGRSHNYHFTMHLEGLLAFSDPTAGADKIFTFTGDDDLWIFVDGKLVIDLGGVHGAASASFTEEALKGLGLLAGTAYDLDIFFAERHTVASTFNITTTLDITAPPPPGLPEPHGIALAGIALLALALSRRRKATA
jgi:fibro-slime domain-containing protein